MKKVLVGTFSEKDLESGLDKIKVAEKKKETGLKYTETKHVIKKGIITGLRIWVCDLDYFTSS